MGDIQKTGKALGTLAKSGCMIYIAIFILLISIALLMTAFGQCGK